MRSHAVIIVRIVFQNPTQMFLAQDNDVVQTLAPDRSDQPFGKAILPRGSWCSGLVSNTHGTQSARDDSAVDSISISDHKARSVIPRKSLGDLTLASQDDQLMSKHCILRLKPDVRLEWRGQHRQNEADQRDHRANLADSIIR